jgi:adenine deaminase
VYQQYDISLLFPKVRISAFAVDRNGCAMLHQELENLVQAGLSPYEALCCSTREAARFLGEDAQWGTIAPGKRADLLLVRAHPFADIGAVRDLEAVFVNGFFFDREHLDALLKQRIAAITSLEQMAASTPVLPPARESAGQVM